jgi:zinc and cadmium transporter
MNLIWILGSTAIVSLISLIGVTLLSVRKDFLDNIIFILVGFAAGGLIGTAFLHLLPEAVEHNPHQTFLFTLIGFTIAFVIERYFHWRHCHKGECSVHTFAYINLLGDGLHNFTDGIIIAASFNVGVQYGLVTTFAIILHEIPQEIGDFGVLLYSGFTRAKALFYNFLCSATAILGGLLGYFLSQQIRTLSQILIPFIAGGFIYLAASDLIPELHRQEDNKKANIALLAFMAGLLLMYLAKHSH